MNEEDKKRINPRRAITSLVGVVGRFNPRKRVLSYVYKTRVIRLMLRLVCVGMPSTFITMGATERLSLQPRQPTPDVSKMRCVLLLRLCARIFGVFQHQELIQPRWPNSHMGWRLRIIGAVGVHILKGTCNLIWICGKEETLKQYRRWGQLYFKSRKKN